MTLILFIISFSALGQEKRVSVSGRVLDESGAAVVGASVTLREPGVGFERKIQSNAHGAFLLEDLAPGEYTISAISPKFSISRQRFALQAGDHYRVELILKLGTLTQDITVVSTQIAGTPETLHRIPGSYDYLDPATLDKSRVFHFHEALRKVSGIHVREEEGFGLRPNIGIRGLNPTRSTKVLLLEDGIPITYAPYGDNASYYHPPVERFESIEVLKGSGQILYGPMTVGGVINYITPAPPLKPSGSLLLTGGSRDYFNGQLSYGGMWGQTGLLVDYMRKQGAGARENTRFGLNDLTLKMVTALGPRQTLALKGNFYSEDSNITYSGLREDEYRVNPRQNPFRSDFFIGRRYGVAATHTYQLRNEWILSTNAYSSIFMRDWWRQSSNSNQRPNDPDCGGMVNLNTTCGNEGRLRRYHTVGVEPRLHVGHRLFGVRNETDFGMRLHYERQDRRQENGQSPSARSGALVEDNERSNQAYSAFLQNRFLLGNWTITPGTRIERISYERTNWLANSGAGVSGRTNRTQVVPGLGISYNVTSDTTLFAGAHRGFAPPRTEDIINNTTGGSINLDPELSWNYEIGMRSWLRPGVRLEGTFFRMDYQNQIVPASLAGGVGATLTNGGQTRHQGFELTSRVETGTFFKAARNLHLRANYTYIPVSRFAGARFSSVPGFSRVSVSHHRLPYAPEHLLTAGIGYSHPRGFDAMWEAVRVSQQFADDLNTIRPSPDGQRGLIPGNTTWNATVNYHSEALRATLFVTVKNMLDRTFIVDRARGILPNSPRLIQAGLKFRF